MAKPKLWKNKTVKEKQQEIKGLMYHSLVEPFLLSLDESEFKSKKKIMEDFKEFLAKQPKVKINYPQNWRIYYQNSRNEKLMFLKILKYAVEHLDIPLPYSGNGRPCANYSDVIKALVIKVYHNYSSWRVESELRLSEAMGVIDEVYKRSCLNKYMASPDITEWLHKLYKLVALPLASVEQCFAIDSSGISTFNRKRWVQIRLDYKLHKEYKKLHIVCGVKTNVITSVAVSGGRSNDSPFLKPLLNDTIKSFIVKELSADAGYLSRANCDTVSSCGAVPYIKLKKNTKIALNKGTMGAWGRMIHLWKEKKDVFALHYHKRSNVESTFAMIKKRFGFYVRSKGDIAQENEILCKIICHNIAVLCEALLTYNLELEFMVS